jgi:hypothetical protein
LKKKFQSTFQQAQNLLTRPGSKDTSNRNIATETIDETPALRDQDQTYSGADSSYITPSKYEYLTAKYRDTSLDTKPVANSRWVTANVRQCSPQSRHAYNGIDTPKVRQDHVDNPPTIATPAESNKATSKRILKPSKYSHRYMGAKTDRIGYKTSSKSSPNLLYKDFDDELNDLKSSNAGIMTNGVPTTYSSSTYLHSNPVGQSSTSLYNQYHQPNDNYPYNYSAPNQQRELKWNELDSMLGAQSALLNRLESDFVANRTKLKAAVNITSAASVYPSSSSSKNNSSQNSLVSAYPLRNPYATTTASDLSRPKLNPNRYVSSATSHIDPYKPSEVYLKQADLSVSLASPTDPNKSLTDTVTKRKILKYGGGSASDRKTTILSDIVGSHDLPNNKNTFNQADASIVDLIKDFNIVDSKNELPTVAMDANATKPKVAVENGVNARKYGEHEYLPQALTSNAVANKL